ncbi:MAG: SidE phosphodiesterase domain-containing protein [Parachlamydia sp.]|nr:SidE phosphodiesterase domain-containing protein [Parachlamydia sp.]
MQPTILIAISQHCYDAFLSKKYADCNGERYPKEGTIQGYVVERPNHNLSHILRKTICAPHVVSVFKLNGIITCSINNVTYYLKEELENLQVALLFSVVGRESEVSFKDDSVKYAQYRQRSADAYHNFIIANREKNPHYQKLIQTNKVDFYRLLIHKPQGSCILRRIFRICHSLDLMRCYTEPEYTENLKNIKTDLASGSGKEDQMAYWVDELRKYAIRCLAATGEQNLTLGNKRNPELFVSCSFNAKICLNALQQVSHPAIDTKKMIQGVSVQVLNADKATAAYEKGKVLYAGKDFPNAFKYFLIAAQANCTKAYYLIGQCYYNGQGIPLDYGKAVANLQIAASHGHPHALRLLGICLYHGQGCVKDLKASYQYLTSAAEKGSLEAKKELLELFKTIK